MRATTKIGRRIPNRHLFDQKIRSKKGVTVPAAVKGKTPGRQADAGTVAACRSAKITIAASAALSGAWWANNPIHSATRMNVRPPAPSAIPRCARPITGKASKPASARKMKPKKKSGWRASVGMAESQKRKSQSRDPGDNGGSSSPAFCGLLLRSCLESLSRLIRVRCSLIECRRKIDREKERFKTEENPEGATAFRRVEELRGPAELSQRRPDGREQNQIMPVFAQRDRRHPQIEQRDVKKERGRVVSSARQQDGVRKPPNNPRITMTCAPRFTARRNEKSVTADMAKNAVVREISA